MKRSKIKDQKSKCNVKSKILNFYLSFCILIFSFCIFIVSPVFAQQEYKDYQYQYEIHRDYYQNYIKARDAYLKYQTLTSQEEFSKASQDFLVSRSLVIRTYLQSLKYILREAPDVDPNQKRDLNLSLDQEITWLMDHEKQTKDFQNPTLNDLLELSLRVEKKENSYKKMAYQTLANII